MTNLEELLNLNKFLEKEIKDINMNDISQVISFLKKYIDCQNKIIVTFKEKYDSRTIELSKYKQAIKILKDKMNLAVYHNKVYNIYSIDLLKFKEDFEDELSQEEYELLKEVLENGVD